MVKQRKDDWRRVLYQAVQILGGQAGVAHAVGVTQQAVSNILLRGNECPAEWAPKIEVATRGKIEKGLLRPDLFKRRHR